VSENTGEIGLTGGRRKWEGGDEKKQDSVKGRDKLSRKRSGVRISVLNGGGGG